MNSNLIVMLTHNDLTVDRALIYFDECKDFPVEYWGFKDVGIPKDEMCKLVTSMKNAGKKTILEVVSYTEDSCMAAAKFACKNGFDYLIGTLYFPSVWEYLKSQPINYYPFVGNVYGSPSVLSGNTEDIINQANELYKKNIPGVNILAYRYCDGKPETLAEKVVANIKPNAILAGSIDSIERIRMVNTVNPWGFTIGSALFTEKFINGKGYCANLKKVLDVMESIITIAT